MRLLFLDFDGVLHPCDSGDVRDVEGKMEFVSARIDAPLFCRLPLLIDALRDHPDVRIVISSSWRYLYERNELKAFVGGLADRYLAEIPRLSGHPRHDEIAYFMQLRRLQDVHWIAIDDDRRNFPADCPYVLWTEPKTGLDVDSVAALRKWLEEHANEQ